MADELIYGEENLKSSFLPDRNTGRNQGRGHGEAAPCPWMPAEAPDNSEHRGLLTTF